MGRVEQTNQRLMVLGSTRAKVEIVECLLHQAGSPLRRPRSEGNPLQVLCMEFKTKRKTPLKSALSICYDARGQNALGVDSAMTMLTRML